MLHRVRRVWKDGSITSPIHVVVVSHSVSKGGAGGAAGGNGAGNDGAMSMMCAQNKALLPGIAGAASKVSCT